MENKQTNANTLALVVGCMYLYVRIAYVCM